MPNWHFFFDIEILISYHKGMNLKELRKSKGINQTKASEIVNVPLRTYKRYETEIELSNSEKYQRIFNLLKEYKDTDNSKRSKLKITVVGIGYVGFSIGTLLSEDNEVILVDISKEKVELINKKVSPIRDKEIEEWLKNKKLNIKATTTNESYKDSDLVFIATPTNFNPKTNCFDTSSVESVYQNIREQNKTVPIVIRSTIPIGFTEKFKDKHLYFSPEFLREGQALRDNLRPSRIIIGTNSEGKEAHKIANLLVAHSLNRPPVLFMSYKEAESVKLFANSYLAMRVAFFNELDTYAETNGLSSKQIIEGISQDPRIGDYYNNPSFGYGGYCLPKDTEQLKSSFLDIPNNNLIKAIVESNVTRKEYIANKIIETASKRTTKPNNQLTIGIYRLIMKTGSDNYRSSAIIDVIKIIQNKGIKVVVYEKKNPTLEFDIYEDFNEFIAKSDLIVANRYSKELEKVKEKVYTRDLFIRD